MISVCHKQNKPYKKKKVTMNKPTKIYPNTANVQSEANQGNCGKLRPRQLPTRSYAEDTQTGTGKSSAKSLWTGSAKYPSTDAANATTRGTVQSTLIQSAALQRAMKKKKQQFPWGELSRGFLRRSFCHMDNELTAVLNPEDLNAMNREVNGQAAEKVSAKEGPGEEDA